MRKKEIERKAEENAEIYSEKDIWISEDEMIYKMGFEEGAEWRINSVWHKMCEKPNFSKLPILLQHKEGQIHFIDTTPTSWLYLEKYYNRWVYIEDLIQTNE